MLALYYIALSRESAASQLFWIDQICINQTDLTERTQQVGIMPSIYGNSVRTLGWLGGPTTSTRALFRIYRRSQDECCGQQS
jgi:hypothetical protein